MAHVLDPRVTVGKVSLSVASLERSLRYYQDNIGLRLFETGGGEALLGAGDTPLVHLRERAGARPARRMTGLYHFAIRVPSRLELARTIRHLAESEAPISGASDHLFSEALYLSDPDGHGIEIYRDRDRGGWYDGQGRMRVDTLPMDFDGVLGELQNDRSPWEGIHPETVMGHIHLHVADLPSTDRFYVGVLGFEKPPFAMELPSASFVSAGGYHHHLGLNTWAGVGAPPPAEDTAHLLRYEILFPDQGALSLVLARLDEAAIPHTGEAGGWLVRDPSQNAILLRVA